jgi:glycine/D-amino acid oxidase-like deaminating enzyme
MLTAEPKGYGSNWYATTRVDGPVRPRLSMELDVEVCVIGGGLAGLTVACEVARLGWSVVVLEAKSIAWSASGRNSGVVLPGFGTSVDALIERVGTEAAKTLWAMSEAGAEYVRNAARDMPGVALNENGWLHVSKTDRAATMAHEAAVLAGEFGVEVEPWPADRVQDALSSPRYFHGLHYARGFSLHPLNYALGLAAAAEANGARIFEDTPVLEIDPAGVRKRVVTADSRIRAAHVVLAGGVHMNELAPQFTETLLPVYDTAVITAPLGDELAEAIRYPGAVSDEVDPAGHHYRVIDGRRLMWCGQSAVQLGNPHRQGDALLREIRQTYPALSGVRAEHAWIGGAGRTVHGMPQIGEITPGLWLLNGFGGHGLNTTAMGGEMLARAIVHNDRAWEMFSAFPLVWAGGAFGRASQRVTGWSQQLQDAIGGMLAQRRAPARPRREPVVAEAAAVSPETILEPAAVSVEPIAMPVVSPPAFAEPEPPVALPAFTEPAEPPPPVITEPPVIHTEANETVEEPVAQRDFAEPIEPPVVQPDLTEPVEAPTVPREFVAPVQPRAPRPEIVERIRALMGRPEIPEIEPPPAAASEDAAAPAPPDATHEPPAVAAEAPSVVADPATEQATSTAGEVVAPAEPAPVALDTAAPVEPPPAAVEAVAPAPRKRPKRGPKKRKTPRLLEPAPQAGGSGSGSVDAAVPAASPDHAQPAVTDKKT